MSPGIDETFREKFKWGAGDDVLSQCALCRHLASDSPLAVCAAFPGGIPVRILTNEEDHRRPWIDPRTGRAGDRGLHFEPREGVDEGAVDRLDRSLNALPRPEMNRS